MLRAGLNTLPEAARLVHDPDAGVRREVALTLRDQPASASLDLLVEIARGFDGADRSYLEALGTGATGKEAALYDRLRHAPGVPSDPVAWPESFAWITWRLHPSAAVHDLETRARASKLPLEERRRAMDALAFIDAPAASDAMLRLAGDKGPLSELATWWLLNRLSNSWADHNLSAALKVMGIYDPDTVRLEPAVAPRAPANAPALSIDDIVKLPGDSARGREVATRCLVCHTIAGAGADVGPSLDGWARGKSVAVIARAIVQPSAEIAEGFDGTELQTTDGLRIQGIVIKQGDPLMVRSQGGVTQIVPAKRIASRTRMTESLMLTPAQLGLTGQDVADLIAFLRTR